MPLAHHEVYPEEEVRIVSTGEYDDDDVTGLFGEEDAVVPGSSQARKRGRREVEAGFKNTGLSLGGGGDEEVQDVDMGTG